MKHQPESRENIELILIILGFDISNIQTTFQNTGETNYIYQFKDKNNTKYLDNKTMTAIL